LFMEQEKLLRANKNFNCVIQYSWCWCWFSVSIFCSFICFFPNFYCSNKPKLFLMKLVEKSKTYIFLNWKNLSNTEIWIFQERVNVFPIIQLVFRYFACYVWIESNFEATSLCCCSRWRLSFYSNIIIWFI
jgi:hypothetical protein